MCAARPVRCSARQSTSGGCPRGNAALAAGPPRHALCLGRRRLLPLLAVARDFVLHQQLHLCQHHALCRLAWLWIRLEVCAGRVSAAAAAAPVTAAPTPGPRRSFPASSSSTATRVPMPQPQGAPAQRSAGACRAGPTATSSTARGTTTDRTVRQRRFKPAPRPSSGHEDACAGSTERQRCLSGHYDLGYAVSCRSRAPDAPRELPSLLAQRVARLALGLRGRASMSLVPFRTRTPPSLTPLEQATKTPKRRLMSSLTRSWLAVATSWTQPSYIPCPLVRSMPRARQRAQSLSQGSLYIVLTMEEPFLRRPAARWAH